MANTFSEKAVKFLPLLDEVYKRASVTSMLDASPTAFIGTNKIKIPKITLDGAGDYSRTSGYVDGDVTISYEEQELTFDRGRKFTVDVIDNDETAFDAYRTIASEYVRTKEVPEVDATRFAQMYSAVSTNASGNIASSDTITEALTLFDTAEQTLMENEVDTSNLVLWCSPAFYSALKAKLSGSGRIDYQNNNGMVDRRVTMLDGNVPIIIVPQNRFYSAITLYDGTTVGQEAGGYVGTSTTGYELNFILADISKAKAYSKRNANKIISPEVNQDKDAWAIYYRLHHDLIVPTNGAKGIYIHKKATALV